MSKTRILEAGQNLDVASTIALLDAKPDLRDVTDCQGRNLLHLGCSTSCSKLNVPESVSARMVNDAARFLALKGADVNHQDPTNGKTALHHGVEKEFDPALLSPASLEDDDDHHSGRRDADDAARRTTRASIVCGIGNDILLKVVDAEVEFVIDQSGTVTHAIMRQGGRDQKAPRK